MADNSKSTLWVLAHGTAIVAVLASLFTGLRIASLRFPAIAEIGELLPQGQVHDVHFFSAGLLSLVACGYALSIAFTLVREKTTFIVERVRAFGFHQWVILLGCAAIAILVCSGWLLFSGGDSAAPARDLHFYGALAVALYLFLHGGVYFAQFGQRVLRRIFSPGGQRRRAALALAFLLPLVLSATWLSVAKLSPHRLTVAPLADTTHIRIDGLADETAWSSAEPLTLLTDGGANFFDGRSRVKVRALHNRDEIYFHFLWQDPTESLIHLPLQKTEQGWRVQQDGFHHFDEQRFYEDKFAVLLSNYCGFAAAGTAHLGRKPLGDKPANWHGRGYHYSESPQLHDLWHWKAVRTNDMMLADDNFIGPPDKVRPGQRRYTAGYQKDGKESGSYVMNWKWYKPNSITPKRLPKNPQALAAFQNTSADADWVIPWFDYRPYTAEKDTYPIGTIMPSVMYRSNRFEGDRADVRAHGVWRDGHWSLELVRKLDTGSPQDVPVRDGSCIWVSAFDHAQVAHTRHTRAIRLNLE